MAEAMMVNAVKAILIDHADLIPGVVKAQFKDKCKVSARLREDLGFDDIALIELMVVLEESFGIDIPGEVLAKTGTVKELTELVDKIARTGRP
jgi:acyl carrier protein